MICTLKYINTDLKESLVNEKLTTFYHLMYLTQLIKASNQLKSMSIISHNLAHLNLRMNLRKIFLKY